MSDRTESPAPLKQVQITKTNQYDPAALEFQSKIIHSHTQNTGIFFGRFCNGFAAYARDLAEIRDKGDDIARSLAQFSETQTHSAVSKKHLSQFSSLLAAVQDHMQARILRIEKTVVCGWAKYGAMCHLLKAQVQKGVNIRDREQKYQDDLQKMQARMKTDGDPQARQQKVGFAAMAASDAQRAHDLLLREADQFEQQKLQDVRHVLMNFCQIELAFHAQALKLYTQAYRSAKKLDMAEGISSFRTQMDIVCRSSSVGQEPNSTLENCKTESLPPESSTDSELSSASSSSSDDEGGGGGGGGGGGEWNSPRVAVKPAMSSSLPQEGRKTGRTEKRSSMMASRGRQRPRTSSFATERTASQRYARGETAGTCVGHLSQYQEALRSQRRGSESKH